MNPSLAQYQGHVPNPFAVYRPAIVGMAGVLPFLLGICSYQVPELASCKTVEELATAIQGMKDRINEIHTAAGVQPLDDDARAEWAALQDNLKAFNAAHEEATARRKVVEDLAGNPRRQEEHRTFGVPNIARSRVPENLHDVAEYRNRTNGSPAAMASLMREGAKRILDVTVFPHPNADKAKVLANFHRLLDAADEDPTFAAHIIASTDPAYARAWLKAATGRADLMTPNERAAVATVNTTTAGGYAVPVILDPAVMLTSDGAVNPIRQMARVETIAGAGNTWKGVTSGGISLAYGPAEGSAITPTTSPVLGQPSVTVQPVKGELQYSIESNEDWPRLLGELAVMIQDARDTLEADEFINGTGSGQHPEGVVYGLASTSHVGTTGDGLDAEDIYRIVNRLPPRFRSRAQWLANQLFYDTVAQFQVGDTSDQRMYIRGTGGNAGSLLQWTAREASEMEDDLLTEGNKLALFGDFKAGYLIVDKVGLNVEDAGFVRDGDGKLTGQRALLVHYRNSAVVMIDNAFRLLKLGVVTSG